MFRKMLVLLGGALLLLTMLLGTTPTTHAAADATVSGTINTLSPRMKKLSIKLATGKLVTLKVTTTTTIMRNGTAVKLAKLALRDKITATYNAATKNATKLSAQGPSFRVVKGHVVDANKGTGLVTIQTKTGNVVVNTSANTKISRNNRVASLSNVTNKDVVVVHVTASHTPNSGDDSEDIQDDGPDEGEVHGTISAINGSDVTITPDNGTTPITVHVTADTDIEVNGEDATLADLAVGQAVDVEYDPATMNAFDIEADSNVGDDTQVDGTVSAVGTDTITITPTGGGADVTLNVDASTEIQVNGENATLADVKVGMPVRAEYDSSTMLAKQIDAGSGDDNGEDTEIQGTVSAVDTTADTVTVTPTGGGTDVVLKVDANTDIEVNGEDATIQDITVGAPVQAEYDSQTLVAHEIQVGNDDQGNKASH